MARKPQPKKPATRKSSTKPKESKEQKTEEESTSAPDIKLAVGLAHLDIKDIMDGGGSLCEFDPKEVGRFEVRAKNFVRHNSTKPVRKNGETEVRPGEGIEYPAEVWADYLNVCAHSGNKTYAAKIVRLPMKAIWIREEKDAKFQKLQAAALEKGIEAQENEVRRRAFHGVKSPVFYKGVIVGYETKYSDTLAQFMLSAHKEKYRRVGKPDSSAPAPARPHESLKDEDLDSLIAELEKEVKK